jgi:hypothetical protein
MGKNGLPFTLKTRVTFVMVILLILEL